MTDDSPKWFVLNYIRSSFRDEPAKVVDRFNSLTGEHLELFAPTYVVREERGGEVRFKTANLVFHYVFVRGAVDSVKALCGQSNGFSFLIDRGSESRYAIIDDRKMANFKNIARAYKNCLPYFPIEQVDLEAGDLVEVVKGNFPGLVGYYIPRPKSNAGNIVLNIYNNVGTIAFDVKATDVRVLEFAKNTNRANDQIDAFVPHLLRALRLYSDGQPLTDAVAAKVSTFCGRLNVVKINNRKLDGRLQALLYAANRIMGDEAEAALHLARFQALSESITNRWTRALISLLLGVIAGERERLVESFESIRSLNPESASQRLLHDEYLHYLAQ